jgi:hypothetical protein
VFCEHDNEQYVAMHIPNDLEYAFQRICYDSSLGNTTILYKTVFPMGSKPRLYNESLIVARGLETWDRELSSCKRRREYKMRLEAAVGRRQPSS